MKITKKINDLFQKEMGIKIIAANSNPKFLSNSPTSGQTNLIVEFTGVSGAGKTTLCNYYQGNHNLDLGNKSLLHEKKLKSFSKTLDIEFTPRHKIYHFLLEKKIEFAHKSKVSAGTKFRRIRKFHDHLKDDFIIHTCLDNQIIFFDSHLLNRFKTFPSQLPQNPEIKTFLENRLFIVCSASTQWVIRNIRKRARHETSLTTSENDLSKSINRIGEVIEKQSNRLQERGCKVLHINMEVPLKDNARILDDSINGLLRDSISS